MRGLLLVCALAPPGARQQHAAIAGTLAGTFLRAWYAIILRMTQKWPCSPHQRAARAASWLPVSLHVCAVYHLCCKPRYVCTGPLDVLPSVPCSLQAWLCSPGSPTQHLLHRRCRARRDWIVLATRGFNVTASAESQKCKTPTAPLLHDSHAMIELTNLDVRCMLATCLWGIFGIHSMSVIFHWGTHMY
jgi:hypothetical protein